MMIKNCVGLGVVALATGLLLSGCGATGGVSSTADKPGASDKEPAKASAKVGDAITLKGNKDGSKAVIVVKKVVDPTKSTDGFSKAASGMRYVAVQFQIKNTGTIPYEDSPSNGAKVADADGQQFDSTIVSSVKAGPILPASVKLTPGGKALGYVVFEVPTKSKVKAVQFGMDSGFGSSGEWVVK
jgi:hypothetical protein